MKVDFHLHSDFSGDSETPIREMIEQSIQLGLETICFTDHQDWDYPAEDTIFTFDTDTYFNILHALSAEYADRIKILTGVELGLQPHLAGRLTRYIEKYPFDFIIGSSHVVHRIDPYYPEFFEGRSEEECYQEYFESIIENINAFTGFDVYGHLDYVVRYGPNKGLFYSYKKYADVIDSILRLLIEKGKGIELNTAGLKYGLGYPNPHPDILKRYRELGGEILTIGSDGHKPEHIAYDFDKIIPILLDCGFTHYTVFENRIPSFIKI